MRLYIQEKSNLLKYNLPAKVDGSLLFTYKSLDNDMDYSINIDSLDGTWVLKSNGSINVIGSNGVVSDMQLHDYMCVPVSAVLRNGYTCIFCLPSIETSSSAFSVENVSQITIGRSADNNIVYDQNMMFPKHAIIFKNESDGKWYVSTVVSDENCYLYLNTDRVLQPTLLSVGDVLFANGLRLVWMGSFFKLLMDRQLYKCNGLNVSSSNAVVNNEGYTEVSEADANIDLYKSDEYFSHTPRIRCVLETESISIEPPPNKFLKDDELPFILSIGTSLTMVGMASMNAYNIYSSINSKGATLISQLPGIVTCSTMIISSLLIPLLTKRWNKKLLIRKENSRQVKYDEYLRKKEKEIQIILEKQRQIIYENYGSISDCQDIVINRTRMLWSRKISDEDFIDVRLGIGSRPSYIEVFAPEEKFSLEDDALYDAVCAIKNRYKRLQNIPITFSLKDDPVSAFILVSKFNDAFIDGIMLQLATYHSPVDLKIVVVTSEENKKKWDYVRYLPHCWSDDKQVRYFATNPEDLKTICQLLDEEYSTRKAKKEEREAEQQEKTKEKVEERALYDSYYLIITDNYQMLKGFKFTNDLLDTQFNYGFSMLIIENEMKHLPKECQKFVCVNDSESGVFSEKIKENEMIQFNAEYENLDMRFICNLLANIPISLKDAASQLPNMLPFLEMYNVGKIEQLNIRNRWATSDPISSLQAPVGVHKNGDLFKLDLHEKYDGPHGLIAGSTGSGKSEFIITYILSMAINYDPDEVQFVLIDYKGGGLAGAFENREQNIFIPHLVGTITNLDVSEMNRTLVSIESELKRRQQKFNEWREKTGESTMDIYKYQRLYRAGIIKEPISHLFIISDEFAELKSQQPEFMNQLISTARIGRSLGVHLILATQKPSGVVNDQIWSNSKFKVCLKVQSRADSMEMLKRPEAASIKETGRFYLQVGYDEYFDIGQSAWSGEKYKPVERIVKKNDTSIVFVNDVGEIIKRFDDVIKQDQEQKNYGDQLTNVVKYLQKIAVDDKRVLKKLWLPSLEKTIMHADLIKKYNFSYDDGYGAVIGEYDAPWSQKQDIICLDLLKQGNLLIYGQPGSGKDNIISTIVYDLSLRKSPNDINFYIGDFGSEILRTLKSFPHVGDVFTIDELDKIQNLIKMLDKELDRRKKAYSDYGGSYEEYCKLTGNKEAVIVTALNNYENFLETYPRFYDIFTGLFRDGAKYGLLFIVTTTVSNAVRSKVAQCFYNKICLKMSNDFDYRELLGAPKGIVPADNYGRGVISIDGDDSCYEFQSVMISPKDSRTQFLKDVSSNLCSSYTTKAKKIPILPEVAYVDDVLYELKGLNCVPIGIEKDSLEVYVFSFMELKVNLIAAKSIRSHVYFIYALIREMLLIENVNVIIVDALNIYRGKYDNVTLYNDNLDEAFENIYYNVQNDQTSTKTNVYFCLGINEFKNNISSKYSEYFEELFKGVSKCHNNTFLFFDDSNNYKQLQLEKWYNENVNNTFGIWLGEDIGVQVALGVMSLTIEDKQNIFPCIGYPIYQGKHMTIKYVVDGVDKEDEE